MQKRKKEKRNPLIAKYVDAIILQNFIDRRPLATVGFNWRYSVNRKRVRFFIKNPLVQGNDIIVAE